MGNVGQVVARTDVSFDFFKFLFDDLKNAILPPRWWWIKRCCFQTFSDGLNHEDHPWHVHEPDPKKIEFGKLHQKRWKGLCHKFGVGARVAWIKYISAGVENPTFLDNFIVNLSWEENILSGPETRDEINF